MPTVRLITFSRPSALVVAEQEGFFAKEGLDVTCDITRGSVEQIRGLLAGKWDIAHTAADNVMAYVNAEQVDLFVLLVLDLGLAQKLIVAPEIASYGDLRGKILGVDALDTGYAFVLRRMLALNGLDNDAYQLEAVGGTPQRFQALRDRRVVGALLSPPPEDEALGEGFRLLEAAADRFPAYPGLTVAATRRWAAENDATLLAYTRALTGAARWAADPANVHRVDEMLAKDQNVDVATGRRRHELERSIRSEVLPSPESVRSALQTVLELRRDYTGTGNPLDAYYDGRYAERARE